MFISKAKAHDLQDILAIQHLAYKSEGKIYNDYSIPPLTQTLDELIEEVEKEIVLKAEINEQIVGSVRAYEEDQIGYICRLIVHPDFQGKGIGTTLLLEIEKHFPEVLLFELFTGVKSFSNIRLYEKNGYLEHRREQASEKLSFIYFRKDKSLINS